MDTANFSLEIDGMTCVGCANTIKRQLHKSGATNVTVDFTSKEATFALENPDKEGLPSIIKEIENLGYSVNTSSKKGRWTTLEQRLFIAALFTIPLFLQHMFMALNLPFLGFLDAPIFQLLFTLPVYIIGILQFGKSAYGALKMRTTNMDVLIFIGATAAFFYSCYGLYIQDPNLYFFETAATIITLVLTGYWMEERAVYRTTSAIRGLSDLRVETTRVRLPNGDLQTISVEDLMPGMVVQINEGDSIPADGQILEGNALLDESLVTGESLPVGKIPTEFVLEGTTVRQGQISIQVKQTGISSTIGRMIALMKSAQQDKPPIQRFADQVSAIFVPLVLGIALLTFLIAYFAFNIPFTQALLNAIAVLVISCPCALGLATPTAVMVGIGRLAKHGIMIKGGSTIERMGKVTQIAFDKTGTLTTGNFSVERISYTHPEQKSKIQAFIQQLESRSSHPIAQAMRSAFSGVDIKSYPLKEILEIKGAGMKAISPEGKEVKFGSRSFAGEAVTAESDGDLFLTEGSDILATIHIKDQIREEVPTTIDGLKEEKLKLHILSGDRQNKVEQVAKTLGISSGLGEQMPDAKLAQIKAWQKHGMLAMVGDGINDAPSLAAANVGISIGGASQIALQSAQVVLMGGNLKNLPLAFSLSKKTYKTIRENIFWAFAYNIVAIPLAATGFLNPMAAAFFMAFSDVIVVGNALRLRWR